jgi:hypothetical protein
MARPHCLGSDEAEEREAEAAKRAKLAERLVDATETTARNPPPKVLRSKLTVAEKSKPIAKLGSADAYLELPWSD